MFSFLLYFLITSFDSAECNYYSSALAMKELVDLEAELAKAFIKYYDEEAARLKALESLLQEFEQQNNSTNGEFIYNPIDAYKFLKRFTRGWLNFSQFRRPKFSSEALDEYMEMINDTDRFDSYEEVWGSVSAIIKLQETYKLEVSHFTQYYKYSQTLTTSDIFLIGYYAMSHGYHEISTMWIEEAVNRINLGIDTEIEYYNLTTVYHAQTWNYQLLENYKKAAFYSQKLADLNPHDNHLQQSNAWYQYQAEWSRAKVHGLGEDRFGNFSTRPWLIRNNKLCRQEEKMSQKILDTLYCFYYSPKERFLLKPLEAEIAYNDPHIVLFHNLLTETETDYLVAEGRDVLSNAEVFSMYTGKVIKAQYRTGKSGWLNRNDYNIWKIMDRVGAITGLDMRYSEPVQVMNYGIGGNYESHYDHATPPNDYSIFGVHAWGNRIATMLMYLSDVERGGETVFTNTGPGVVLTPKKGAGVLWYNLKRNGDSDDATKHAGCPIILGEKWVANLWIHEWGQFSRRPCTLNPYE